MLAQVGEEETASRSFRYRVGLAFFGNLVSVPEEFRKMDFGQSMQLQDLEEA